jgi:hypothetical protein
LKGVESEDAEIHAMQASAFIDFWIKSMRIHKPDAREGDLLDAFHNAVKQKIHQLSLRRGVVEPVEDWSTETVYSEGSTETLTGMSLSKDEGVEFMACGDKGLSDGFDQAVYLGHSILDEAYSNAGRISDDSSGGGDSMTMDLRVYNWTEDGSPFYSQRDEEENKDAWTNPFITSSIYDAPT